MKISKGTAKKKHLLYPELNKTKRDLEIDTLIEKSFGKTYTRATIYDFYPLELSKEESKSLDAKSQAGLMNYYDYERDNLEKISQGKLLKFVQMDFDLDKVSDYAVVVHNKKNKKNYLVIFDAKSVIYEQEFEEDYIEPVNYGRHPVIVYSNKKAVLSKAPVLRLVDFEDEHRLLYFDKVQDHWIKIKPDA